MVAVPLLAVFDVVGFAIFGDEVVKVIVNGFAELVTEETTETWVFGHDSGG